MLGALLAARYRVTNILGSGGFGHTYIAEDTQRPGNPRCVLKHLTFASTNPAVLQQVRRLFQAEAETLERLGKHDQIPRLLAYFEENQEFYLVQEFIAGHSLSDELLEGLRLPETQVIAFVEDVLGILEFVHAQGVIHRDIKPENLIRREQDNKIVLIDFGAVKAIGTTVAQATGETALSVPIYTSGYGASEQCMGRPRFNSDIYSLGMVAIQSLTGLRPAQLPQDFNTCEVIWRDQAPQVSDRFAAVLDRMTCYHCNHRYQSATEVLQALHAIGDRQPAMLRDAFIATPQPVQPVATQVQTQLHDRTRLAPPRSRWPGWKWGVVIGLGVAALAGAVVAHRHTWFFNQNLPPSEQVVVAQVRDRISTGERMLSQWRGNSYKQEAVAQMAAGNYSRALTYLEAARQRDRSDPETLIYLNNARIGNARAHTIAVAVPLGDAFGSAVEILRGVAQVQDTINQAGGINGVPVKLAIANDDNQPEIAKQLAQALVQDSNVLAVVGHSISDTTLAAAEIYQTGELVMVSPLSSAVKLSNLGSYIFRTMPSDRLTAKALASHMLERLKQKKAVVFFNSRSAYSQSLKNEFKNALFYNGVDLLGEVDLSRPDFDPDERVNQAIAQGAQVLMLAADHSTVDRAIQVVIVNQQRLPVLAGDSFYTSRILTVGGNAVVGAVLAVPADLSQSPFQQQFQQLWGKAMTAGWRSALAFDAMQAIAEGLRRDPTRSGIQRTLAQPDFAAVGAEGKVSFQPTGDRQGNVQLVTIAPVRVGKQTRYNFKSLP
jgi:ABC-type branched-subunit amino acid transport system substrate-binding protein/predicted Ser/Thr protein kinase